MINNILNNNPGIKKDIDDLLKLKEEIAKTHTRLNNKFNAEAEKIKKSIGLK